MKVLNESEEKLLNLMKQWQKIEDTSIQNTTDIIVTTENPLVQLIMEVIRQDSVMHRRVQQMILDNYEKEPINVAPKELSAFWDMVEAHDTVEKQTIVIAEEAYNETKQPLIKYLLSFLLNDEKKHDKLLDELDKIRKGDFPYNNH